MPSKTEKQRRFMAAVANNPAFAKKVGVPQSVGKEYETADEGKKFRRGGKMSNCGTKRMKSGGALKMVEKNGQKVPFYAADGKGKMKSGGKVAGYHKMPDGSMMKDSEHKMMGGGKVMKYERGGSVRGYGMARGGKPCKMR